jgi:hypothetical protein
METTTNLLDTRDPTKQIANNSLACAYILVIPPTDGPVLEALQKLLGTLSTQEPLILPMGPRKSSLEIVDPWLEHVAAAEYIGVARSTLDRYSEHHEIESRKFCGRLQYRLSSLDEFKFRHVRPARSFHSERGIIRSAPRSGKSEER